MKNMKFSMSVFLSALVAVVAAPYVIGWINKMSNKSEE